MAQTDLRIVKTRELIERAFLECLDEDTFQNMTVKKITAKARINRSTFYKHYQDKYDLKDRYVDQVLEEFTKSLDVTFLEEETLRKQDYHERLKESLVKMRQNKEIYQILWKSYLPERDVFGEMIERGTKRLEEVIRSNKTIQADRKEIASLYSNLFVGTMMISVRWWFLEGVKMDVDTFTRIMILHMEEGIIQTLQGRMNY
ncbi:MAG: TetR family transcriptional regulator [Eubacterium sp.]|nr:TetR family transcriptional regulator [Eubacterium sp.]